MTLQKAKAPERGLSTPQDMASLCSFEVLMTLQSIGKSLFKIGSLRTGCELPSWFPAVTDIVSQELLPLRSREQHVCPSTDLASFPCLFQVNGQPSEWYYKKSWGSKIVLSLDSSWVSHCQDPGKRRMAHGENWSARVLE